MVILLICVDGFTGGQVELAVQRELAGLVALELLDAARLLDPTLQDPAHALHRRLAKLVRLASVIVYPPVNRKSGLL